MATELTQSNFKQALVQTHPKLALSRENLRKLLLNKPSRKFLRQVVHHLTTPPYFLEITGLMGTPYDGRQSEIIQLLTALQHKSLAANDIAPSAVSYTEISIQSQKPLQTSPVTRDSRTDKPLALHTDESYAPTPCSVMGFQCLTADEQGGESIFHPLSTLLTYLSDADIKTLQQPIFPHGRHYCGPILFGPTHDLSIRYYRSQLNIHLQPNNLDPNTLSLLDKIDNLLSKSKDQYRLKLAEGSLMIFNNHKVLHGRTALPADSKRLLYRGRAKINLQKTKEFLAPWYQQPQILPRKIWSLVKPIAQNTTAANTPPIKEMADIENLLGQLTPERALEELEQTVKAQPNNISLLFGLAALYRTLGHKKQAEDQLQMACERQPFTPPLAPKHHAGHTAGRDIILIRGLRHTKYHFTQDRKSKTWSIRLSQGHFALGALLNPHLGLKRHMNYFDQSNWSDLRCPDHALFINTIACADRMEQPLTRLASLLDQAPLQSHQIINHPRYVLKTKRDSNAQNLQNIDGIYFPQTYRLHGEGKSASDMLNAIEATGLSYPLILRPTVTHTGKYVAKVENATQALEYFKGHHITGDYYAIDYIETANSNGLYNKNRLFCIDGKFYPVAGLHHDRWNIHSKDRYSVMQSTPALQQFEQDYLADLSGFVGDRGMEGLKTISKRLKLDFFGCDFTKLPDGRLLIFECNASMRHNFDHAGNFPYTAPYLQTISKAFSDMAENRLRQIQS